MTDPKTDVRPDPHERELLLALSESGGWTASEIARTLGHQDTRKHGAIVRHWLLTMEMRGWVTRLDDQAPTAWMRTRLGSEVMRHE